DAMKRLLAASALDAGLVREAFDAILSGEWTPVQVGAFAIAARMRGETAEAIVVAACEEPVAKHGNRSISSQCGSADVIEALGLPIDLAPQRQADLLRDVGIAFLFAPAHH